MLLVDFKKFFSIFNFRNIKAHTAAAAAAHLPSNEMNALERTKFNLQAQRLIHHRS
jgi:hypothetical protein